VLTSEGVKQKKHLTAMRAKANILQRVKGLEKRFGKSKTSPRSCNQVDGSHKKAARSRLLVEGCLGKLLQTL